MLSLRIALPPHALTNEQASGTLSLANHLDTTFTHARYVCVCTCVRMCVCVCVCVCLLLCRVRIHEPRSSLTFDCFPLPTQHTTNRTSVCCRSNAAVKTASLRQHQDSASVSGAARSDTEFDGGVGGVTALPIRRFSASFHCVPCVR